MKGVLLAGGAGTRLRPLTKIINKHLLPVGGYPMIHYAICKMAEAGIRDIMLIIGKQSAAPFIDYIGDGKAWNVNVTFRIQDSPGGIAQALSLAEGFIPQGGKLLLLLGDNLFDDSLKGAVDAFDQEGAGAHLFLTTVPDPERYGVPVFTDAGGIGYIEEKPAQPKSNLCVTGIYMYDSSVFEMIRTLRPSSRGELEITDVNNLFAASKQLSYSLLEGWWTDAGTHRSILEASLRLTGGLP